MTTLTDAPTKTCTKCHETKPLEDFYRMKASRDGRRAQCKPCQLASERDYRERNREAIRERDRERKRLGRTPQRATPAVYACNYPKCRRHGTEDGLCKTHHDEVSGSRESPLALTGGRWVRVGLTERWVAA